MPMPHFYIASWQEATLHIAHGNQSEQPQDIHQASGVVVSGLSSHIKHHSICGV